MRKAGLVACAVALVMLLAVPASADLLDPFDNMSAPPGTFFLAGYFSYMDLPDYESDGQTVTTDFKAWNFILRPVWFGPKIAGKMSWGLNAAIPVGQYSMDGEDTQSGLGDIAISPFIFLYENEKNGLYVSFWEFVYMPTGKYDENNPDTSLSLDAWQSQSQLAVGWYPSAFGLDWTVNYWYRGESNELNIDYTDAIESDLILHYTFGMGLTVGVMGSFWWDTTEMKIDGQDVPNTKGHRYAAGLNAMYPITESFILSARWLNNFDVEANSKGNWFYLRAVYVF